MNHYSSFCLRVLRGVNKGAIANFNSESIIIGASDDCDIILSGFSVAEKRLEISLKNNTFLIRALNQPLYIDGIKVLPSKELIPFKLYQLIDFSGCCVAIGERGRKWPVNINKKGLPIRQHTKKNLYAFLVDYIKGDNSEKGLSDKQKIVFTIVAFLLIGGLFLLNIEPPKLSQEKLLISKITPSISLTISKKENYAEKQAYALLQTFGVNRISLEIKDNGLLIAKGYVGSSKNWEKAKTSILGDIDAITKIDADNVETFVTRAIELNKMIQKKGIKKSLSIKINEEKNTISVSGELVNSDITLWNEVKNLFANNYNNDPLIKGDIIDIEKKLRLSIQGVSIGHTKYFTSEAGKKYMIGADLGNGFKVEAIEIDKVILSYKGNKIPIFYNKLI